MLLKDRRILLLLALSLIRGLIYSVLTPPWQTPDEPRHYEYVRLLYDKRRPLTRTDLSLPMQREVLSSMYEFDWWRYVLHPIPDEFPLSFAEAPFLGSVPSEVGIQPPLYYLLCALFYAPVAHQDMVVQVYVLRFVSVCLGTLGVLVAFLIARELFPEDDFLIIGIPAMVAFIPMRTFINGAINNDNLAEPLVSLLIYILIKSLRRGFSFLRVLGIGILVGLGLVTKRTTFVNIPLVMMAAVAFLQKRIVKIRSGRQRAAFLAGVLLIVASLGASSIKFSKGGSLNLQPWLSRLLVGLRVDPGLISALFDKRYYTAEALDWYWLAIRTMFQSFWAQFGWMALTPDPVWRYAVQATGLTAAGGLILLGWRILRNPRSWAGWQKQSLLLLFSCVILAAVIAILRSRRQLSPISLPQGRYIFPAVVPIATLLMLGWRQFVPARYYRLFLVVCITSFFLLDALCQLYYIIPFFYG